MPLELALSRPRTGAIPQAWRVPLLQLALAWAGLIALTGADWAEMARQWWNASTYNHILLVPPILAWLVRLRWPELAKLTPRAWWPGFAWLIAGVLAWLAGTEAGINLVTQAGAVMMLQGTAAILLGPRATAGLLFPLAFMLFLVPFGDEIVPPLQHITARIAVALTHASGVRAQLIGVFIDTPVGRFEVAQACSGVKFLVAMVALGALAAHLGFRTWRRRAAFMAACVAVPIVANGVRAWGTIFIAQSRGVQLAAGFDHIVYGWIFFAVVIAAVLAAAWQFFDRSPDDPAIDAAKLAASSLLSALEKFSIGGWKALGALLILPMAAVAATGVHP
jgi:exosortase A